ncbi:MAG TPA: Ig-like domain-containing protein [Gemmatimonadales bacterium]
MKASWICRTLLAGVLVLAAAACRDPGPLAPASPVAFVAVTPDSVTIAPNDTTRLVATPRDAEGHALTGRAVIWSTSNAAIATVTGGLVTARVLGAATITATAEGRSGAAVISVVTPVASVTVSPSAPTLAPGDTVQLRADAWDAAGNLLAGRTVVWSSSDPAVAPVSPTGLVKAAAAGSATITARVGRQSANASVEVAQGPITFASVSAGGAHTCGLDVNGVAYCWGANNGGQLGNGTLATSVTPRRIVGDLRFSSLTAGQHYTCGLTAAGAAYCWGDNTWGQLGNGTLLVGDSCPGFSIGLCSTVPVAVTGGHSFVAIANGYDHTCAVTTAGQAFCWGWGDVGVLGADVSPCNDFPATPGCSSVPILADHGTPYVGIVAGFEHTCGLRPGGAAYCWGHEHNGQLGTGSDVLGGPTARAVTGGLLFTALSAGGNSSCGVAVGGVAYCWGENNVGQLGDQTTVNRLAPVAVSGGLSFTSVAVGGGVTLNHSCGLVSGGAAYCWGSNSVGQLGDGTPTGRTAPGAVAGGLLFGSITAGGEHTCGLTSNQVAFCWGANDGRLGNASTAGSNLPVRVARQP